MAQPVKKTPKLPEPRQRPRRADLAKARKGMPLWAKLLGATFLPLVGFAVIGYLVGTGEATFDEEHFLGNLPRVIIGAAAIGVALHMFIVRFGRGARDMTGLARIGALVLFCASTLIAVYVLAPRSITRHVDAGLGWAADLFVDFVDYVRGDEADAQDNHPEG